MGPSSLCIDSDVLCLGGGGDKPGSLPLLDDRSQELSSWFFVVARPATYTVATLLVP